jgi:hypothetical protein
MAQPAVAGVTTSVRFHTHIPVFHRASSCKKMSRLGGNPVFMYNVDLLRQLCRDIANEKDPQKEQDLVSVLQAVMKEDQEEIRVRMAFLAKKYAEAISDSKAAD